jgi:teichuronic acid biosynthesis glycosyltransferase TuaG
MKNYIENAFLSIINQSYQDFEIIIVNDNSSDDTAKILKKLQLEDNRIKLINHNAVKLNC